MRNFKNVKVFYKILAKIFAEGEGRTACGAVTVLYYLVVFPCGALDLRSH